MSILKLTYKDQVVLSNTFNMKAYRTMFEILSTGEITVELLDIAATQGLVVLFEGTEITEDVIIGWLELDADELEYARNAVIQWYSDVEVRPSNQQYAGEPPPNPYLHFYKNMLNRFLPSEIDKQDPQLLFDILACDDYEIISADEIPDEYKVYYGL